jgi:hypothetical protein
MPFGPAIGESKAAFDAFLCYAGINGSNSFRGVARKLGLSASRVKRWALKFDWVGRMQVRNSEVLRTRVEVEKRTREDEAKWRSEREREWREGELALAMRLRDAALVHLKALDGARPGKVRMGEIVRALDVCSKLARLSIGEVPEKKEVASVINVDIQAALDRVYGKPIPGEVVAEGTIGR